MKPDPTLRSGEFRELNKRYYRTIEDYDWVRVVDHLIGFESFFHRSRVNFTLQLIRRFGIGTKYLDAGCGTGLFLRHLPANSHAVDMNPRHLEKAKFYVPDAVVVEADIEKLPFPDASFSTILCAEVLEHDPAPERPLAELVRVLEPGGRLIGTVPRKKWVWRLRWLSSTRPHEPYHKEYRRSELQALLSPYQIVHMEKGNFGMNWGFVLQKT